MMKPEEVIRRRPVRVTSALKSELLRIGFKKDMAELYEKELLEIKFTPMDLWVDKNKEWFVTYSFGVEIPVGAVEKA